MNKLFVESSPHIRSAWTTQKIMLNVIIALCPALVMSTYIFGIKALLLTVICCACCVLFEFLFNKITKRADTISDLSAVVTGMLLAFNLPVDLPVYMAVIGCFVAVVIVKCLFGGIGQNFANPAITARIVLMMSFAGSMTKWTAPFAWKEGVDATVSATPLAAETLPSLTDMLLGFRAGCLGETCVAALLLGGLYLMCIGLIRPATPLCFIGTVAVLSFLYGDCDVNFMLYQLMSGGLILGAFFMATDYATTPLTTKGKIIFGVCCGVITFAIRQYASMPEGVSFSILVMNCLTPLIDRFTAPRALGAVKPEKEGKK
ncbi:MAG: RnfABCDGE type electron transport complex subunit D [Lachnospiraceae bacterium]|nr:RnfABCDGE type electron transport complex subunit D [Ruminococcus sp.]MCM1274351.1 RnfABCDGE type electron transport complex subunit D [Lachnospiraceae bacterium]